MGKSSRQIVLLDSSVLINFLIIARLDLLFDHPLYQFVVTDHVRGEILDGGQRRRLAAAIRRGDVEVTTVDDPVEVQTFGQLLQGQRLGPGECAVIAAAKNRGLAVAMDDRVAGRVATEHLEPSRVLNTPQIIRSLIDAGVLTVREADRFIGTWSRNSFTLPFPSFGTPSAPEPPAPRRKRRK